MLILNVKIRGFNSNIESPNSHNFYFIACMYIVEILCKNNSTVCILLDDSFTFSFGKSSFNLPHSTSFIPVVNALNMYMVYFFLQLNCEYLEVIKDVIYLCFSST